MAAQSGATLIADGCDTAEQAATLRDHGVYQVQGHLLGRAHRCPVPAAVLERRTTPATESAITETAPGSGTVSPGVAADLVHPAGLCR